MTGQLSSERMAQWGNQLQRYIASMNNATQRYNIDQDAMLNWAQLPVAYGNMYTSAYSPMYSYGQSQGNNMAQLGGQAMGLYGNLAGQQASMYQSELPMQMEMSKWNSLAPALSGLLGQLGVDNTAIGPLNVSFNRPDVMGGYAGAVSQAKEGVRGYDDWMNSNHEEQMARMPQQIPSRIPSYGAYGGGDFGGSVGKQEPPYSGSMTMTNREQAQQSQARPYGPGYKSLSGNMNYKQPTYRRSSRRRR
jgi:hypothetical protein